MNDRRIGRSIAAFGSVTAGVSKGRFVGHEDPQRGERTGNLPAGGEKAIRIVSLDLSIGE